MNDLTPIARLSAPQPAKSRAPAVLTGAQKAAIIVRFLLKEGADLPLTQLPEDLQGALTHELGAMRYVDRDTLAGVLAEFADELERMGLTFPAGLAGALTALEGRISPQTAARLRKEAGVRQMGDPWDLIRELSIDDLLPAIEREATEVAAVLLSKLPVAKAAELLGRLPGDRARRITYAVSQTSNVTPDAVDRIGMSLAAQFQTRPVRAFDESPDERLGAILNISQAQTREDVLSGLDQEDADFSGKVRKAIFTFVHIPARLNPVDVPKITRDVDQADLVTALSAALTGPDDLKLAANFILSNISKRMAENLREEIGEAGKIKPRDGEAAMTEVINAIRQLQTNGEITLIATDEEDDPDA